jgi:peptidoglycan/xylan/chitin deacetylase (PgdA/CDA1 family)
MELPNGKTAAISLCFDGGHREHLELVSPMLAAADMRATFFVTAPSVMENVAAWRHLARDGHEIANHSQYRTSLDGELRGWSLSMVEEDLLETSRAIFEATGIAARSFAYDGPNSICAEGDYSGVVERRFATARLASYGMNDVLHVDSLRVRCISWSDFQGDPKIALPAAGQWSVPVFDRFFTVETAAAERDLEVLLGELALHPEIWAAPMAEVVAGIPPSDSR